MQRGDFPRSEMQKDSHGSDPVPRYHVTGEHCAVLDDLHTATRTSWGYPRSSRSRAAVILLWQSHRKLRWVYPQGTAKSSDLSSPFGESRITEWKIPKSLLVQMGARCLVVLPRSLILFYWTSNWAQDLEHAKKASFPSYSQYSPPWKLKDQGQVQDRMSLIW